MGLEDPRGLALTAQTAGPEHDEAALDAVVSCHGDPIGAAEAALGLDPTPVSPPMLKAHTLACSLHPGLLANAEAYLDAKAAGAWTGARRASLRATTGGSWALYHVDHEEPASARALRDERLASNRRSITLEL